MRRLAEEVAQRFLVAKEMTWEKALEVLGFPPGSHPSESEINRVYRDMSKKIHPDRGGDQRMMVELNVAKDILKGDREPVESPADWGFGGGGVSYPGAEGVGVKVKPFEEKVVTFDEAKSKASIPNSTWLFVTQPVSSGYSTDSSARRASGWVAVGERDKTWDFVVVENTEDASYFIGGGHRHDIYTIQTMSIPKKGPADARTLYGGVMKAWKLFDRLEKRFNSKVIPLPDGWKFSNKWPSARVVSIKNFLLNTGVMSEGDLKTPRKYTIEIHNERSHEDKPGFFKPSEYGDWYKLTLVINGREVALTEAQGEKLAKLRISGKRFMDRIFGEYYYGGETKSLSRNRDGKKIMAWMAENLPGLSDEVIAALKAASS